MNSNAKGNAREREVCSDLEKRFNMKFYRTIQSGASATRSASAKSPKKEFIYENTGDIQTPSHFRFTIEAKHYSSFDIFTFWSQNCLLSHWFEQAKADAERIKKDFLVLFKFNRKKKMALLDISFKDLFIHRGFPILDFSEKYIVISQNDLFSMDDNFFFCKSVDRNAII